MPKVISIQVNRSQELNNTNSSRVIAWQDLGCWIDVGYTVIQKKHVAWRHSHTQLKFRFQMELFVCHPCHVCEANRASSEFFLLKWLIDVSRATASALGLACVADANK